MKKDPAFLTASLPKSGVHLNLVLSCKSIIPIETMNTKIVCWQFEHPNPDVELAMKFVCERKEVVMDLVRLVRDGEESPARFVVFKKPDKLVLVDEEMRQLSGEVCAGKQTTLEKARAI